MENISELINNLGFPTVCVVGLAWYVNKIHKETIDMQIKQAEESNKAIEEARVINRNLLDSNKELLEVNRTLADTISVKVDEIENNLLEIKTKLLEK